MQHFRRWLSLVIATIGVTAAVGMLGCGTQNSITGDNAGIASQLQEFADPLNGVLDSTDGMTPSEPAARIERLGEVLGLDNNQLALLLAAYTEFRSGLAALHAQVRNGAISRMEAHARMEILRDALEAELQVILTEEQYDLLQEMRASRHGHGRHGRPLAERWEAWLVAIGASEQQTGDVLAALETLHTGVRSVHEQVLSGNLTREQARPQVEALRADFDAALQSILTHEQYEELEELRPDCRRGG